mmetsp:Transcript_68474/g.198620  ORF Transcript_68474/g.198620 Transcript_68474/m.198620 type:complete len:267 (+) Transcript_68474:180-980(+)|eukprot:CAMPEP_0176033972 /NCGR_PEP_ID=MMETSP0120_2-20121206/16787_1 /TAXON_ID=160619 /ORGANISM="Kryptoperidinium foliaceum, Strain CCMP 1326" /LENGTH=266 /DNA_ID=CAMNT_0017367307 /DNA_START=125 /DNA_END=925 /DNA_ORIENTATION=+
MHIAAALDQPAVRFGRRSSRSLASAGVGVSSRARGRFCCPFGGAYADLWGGRPCAWFLVFATVGVAVLCIGVFEATRLTTHILKSPCTVVGGEIVDVGTCTLCDEGDLAQCEVHPIATARLIVNFVPMHSDENVSGSVWYCKERARSNPCQRESRYTDQLSLDISHFSGELSPALAPVPCTVGEVHAYMQQHLREGGERQCFYSTRDTRAEDVWLSMPSPGLVDHVWFQQHFEYSMLLSVGGLVLLSVLLSCLALEGAELWAAGVT